MSRALEGKTVRSLEESDIPAIAALEERVWKPKGVERASEETLRAWLCSGTVLGCFRGEVLLGYAYGERVSFSSLPPYSEELLAVLDDYRTPRRDPSGNALHGVSMASTGAGAGALLLDALVSYARAEGLSYFVSLTRLAGLGRFSEEHPELLHRLGLQALACAYAFQAVCRGDPALAGPPLRLFALPEGFPGARKDPVAGRFARIGKELWAVAEARFPDPESLGCSALLVLPLEEPLRAPEIGRERRPAI